VAKGNTAQGNLSYHIRGILPTQIVFSVAVFRKSIALAACSQRELQTIASAWRAILRQARSPCLEPRGRPSCLATRPPHALQPSQTPFFILSRWVSRPPPSLLTAASPTSDIARLSSQHRFTDKGSARAMHLTGGDYSCHAAAARTRSPTDIRSPVHPTQN
jgi:hypothetical protein